MEQSTTLPPDRLAVSITFKSLRIFRKRNKKVQLMADQFPPDDDRWASRRGADKSGNGVRTRTPAPSQSDGGLLRRNNARGRNNASTWPDGSSSKGTSPTPVPPVALPAWQPAPYSQRRQAYAALDLGTNNCRLLIARPSGESFTVIDAFSRVVRLGEGLAKSGRLSDHAIERTLGALKVCAEKLRKRNVHLARSVATEACRRAANGTAFVERVRAETGIALDIISAEEEARLAVLGCHILLEDNDSPAVIFDIGGGSTELVLIEPGGKVPRILDWQSVPWGVVSLTDTVEGSEASEADRIARYRQMRKVVFDSFGAFAERIEVRSRGARDIRLLGTSGTVTTLASLHLELPQYDRQKVDGLIVPANSMRDITARLSRMSPMERGTLPCIGPDRADLVVAGCAILEAIMDIWPAERLGVADRGIREGILRSLMSADAEGERCRQELRSER